ncbi:unnamed protein product, partial [Symbiodinium sp. CCMP2456]
ADTTVCRISDEAAHLAVAHTPCQKLRVLTGAGQGGHFVHEYERVGRARRSQFRCLP